MCLNALYLRYSNIQIDAYNSVRLEGALLSGSDAMRPKDLILRCYVEQQGNLYVAVCIDLCLADQDHDPKIAVKRLHAQMVDHIKEAFKETRFTEQLLSRKSPMAYIFKYHWIRIKTTVISKVISTAQGTEKVFYEAMPLRLA